MATFPNRIYEIRTMKGVSRDKLAAMIGSSRQQMMRLEKGERRLTTEWMQKIGNALGVPPSHLLREGDAPASALSAVTVVGAVQAGVWRPAMEWPEDDRYSVAVPHGHWYSEPHYRAFGLEVRGASMDLEYPAGTVLICIPVGCYPHGIGDEDHVVVQQRDPATGDVEATVKELRIDDQGRAWLVPRSSQPEHQTPIKYTTPADENGWHDAGCRDVEVVAVVVADIRERAAYKKSRRLLLG